MREKFDAAMLEELVDYRSGLLNFGRWQRHAASACRVINAMRDLHSNVLLFVRKQEGRDDRRVMESTRCSPAALEKTMEKHALYDLRWLVLDRISLDEARNRSANNPINDPHRCQVLVIASEEDTQIARHTWAVVPQSRS
jgi:acetate kinase